MKKTGIYIGIMLGMAVLLSSAYYISYKNTLEKYREKAQISKAEEKIPAGDEVVLADTTKEDRITNKTRITLITFDSKNNAYQEEHRTVVPTFIGKTREELISFLGEYMDNLSLDEIKKGLIAYELQSFSKDAITLVKTYDVSSMPYEYYISLAGYEVVVFYCDKKTVFEYTGIDSRRLEKEEQKKLIQGIYVLDQEELYGMLENYSS
ncbi:MAG: BofC C-terminal domain-containing protein [Acetivibrio sp.]